MHDRLNSNLLPNTFMQMQTDRKALIKLQDDLDGLNEKIPAKACRISIQFQWTHIAPIFIESATSLQTVEVNGSVYFNILWFYGEILSLSAKEAEAAA